MGPGPGEGHMVLQQDYALRTIWDVIGKIPGTQDPNEPVIVGNHRDAWVFGAVDPTSGTPHVGAVHGNRHSLTKGWKPKQHPSSLPVGMERKRSARLN